MREHGATCCSGCSEDPDATAEALLERLQSNYPDRFTDAQLRTLQRSVRSWRGIMAKKLVYAVAGEPRPEFHEIPELALVGGGPSAKVSVTFLSEATRRQK